MPFFLPTVAGPNYHHVPLSLRYFAAANANLSIRTDPEFAAFRRYEPRQLEVWTPRVIAACQKANLAGIPADVRETAERYSRELTFTLSVFRSRVVRDRAHGALDSTKLARLATPGISARAFERLAASAYKHREHAPAPTTRPRVAIVADTCHDIRTADPEYMGKVGTLAYTLGEAARLAGVEVAMFHSRGTLWQNPGEDNIAAWRRATGAAKPLHIITHVAEWGETIDPATFHIAQDHNAFVQVLRATSAHFQHNAQGMGSSNGRGAVEYARLQGAQIVIALGDCDAGADIALDPSTDIAGCVAAIVAHMAKREAA